MLKPPAHIAMLGECMVELRQEENGLYSRGFGGDVLNTAVYLARLVGQDVKISFATLVGDDAYSAELVTAWEEEGVDCSLVGVKEASRSGLYVIETDEKGERSFLYWRSAAPARDIMKSEWQDLQDQIFAADWIYLSGISLAILPEEDRHFLCARLEEAKEQGKTIIFDGNYRPLLWPDKKTARFWYERVWKLSSLALAGIEDEMTVFGDQSAKDTRDRLQSYGIQEIVIKQGSDSVLLLNGNAAETVEIDPVEDVLDTTAAGDSFNAGYLAARIQGRTCKEASKVGAALATEVIQHRGAIISRGAMPALDI